MVLLQANSIQVTRNYCSLTLRVQSTKHGVSMASVLVTRSRNRDLWYILHIWVFGPLREGPHNTSCGTLIQLDPGWHPSRQRSRCEEGGGGTERPVISTPRKFLLASSTGHFLLQRDLRYGLLFCRWLAMVL